MPVHREHGMRAPRGMAPVRSSSSRPYARHIGTRGTQERHGGPPPDGTRAASVSRLEAQLQRGRTRHPVPVWRSASKGHGVLPLDGEPGQPYGGRAPDEVHPPPAPRIGINNNRKRRGYRCKLVMSPLGTSPRNYRGVMRFIGGAHDPAKKWSAHLNNDHHGRSSSSSFKLKPSRPRGLRCQREIFVVRHKHHCL